MLGAWLPADSLVCDSCCGDGASLVGADAAGMRIVGAEATQERVEAVRAAIERVRRGRVAPGRRILPSAEGCRWQAAGASACRRVRPPHFLPPTAALPNTVKAIESRDGYQAVEPAAKLLKRYDIEATAARSVAEVEQWVALRNGGNRSVDRAGRPVLISVVIDR